MRRLLLLLVLCVPLPSAHAQAALGGALQGLGEFGRILQQQQQQEELLQQQHNLEMLRIERRHQLQMEATRQQQEINQQQAAQRFAIQKEADRLAALREKSKVDAAHPGWEQMVSTASFKGWVKQQPESVQRLTKSERAEDAILMLDLYKRDVPRQP